MTRIGMLHYRQKPHHVTKAFAYAAAAKMHGSDFFYFSYTGIDFEQRRINGWVYQEGDWHQQDFPFPEVIINISAPRSSKQKAVSRALRLQIPFISRSIGSKLTVYNKIKKGRQFAGHLIPSRPIEKIEDIRSFLKDHPEAVIKPLSGRKGESIHFITRQENGSITWQTGVDQQTFPSDTWEEKVTGLLREKRYLIQPYIECRTKAGFSYDFRLHVHKNKEGRWQTALIYPRVSGTERLTSNVSLGGYRGELIPFLKEEFDREYYNIKQLLEYFAVHFAAHFESLYPGRSFDELGIDAAVDRNHKIWIYEVNWRPGSRHREFAIARHMIPYACYTARQYKSKR
ncbi:YheC/YheD family protein [Halobacillus litoralis]|uniref:YheC/YheD family endospore coat-associated protein n=1 Tax=Halobacillus litoralis TaxID=45668 RepID=UPI001CD80522|nr:YheC/YheD family protein [Halobacillus litoralis]MCA1022032.1 YheC/YheD family protein [Halobacillus litoralis]